MKVILMIEVRVPSEHGYIAPSCGSVSDVTLHMVTLPRVGEEIHLSDDEDFIDLHVEAVWHEIRKGKRSLPVVLLFHDYAFDDKSADAVEEARNWIATMLVDGGARVPGFTNAQRIPKSKP